VVSKHHSFFSILLHFALLADAGKGFGAAAGGFLKVYVFVIFIDNLATENFFKNVL
jgi:hypothetical protein